MSSRPFLSTFRRWTTVPSFSRCSHSARIAGCSTTVVMIWLRSGCALSAERIAVESDSVPQEVKMISVSCSAPSSFCTATLASFSPCATLLPKLCIDEALPNCSVKYGSMASTTARSQAVVALLSR